MKELIERLEKATGPDRELGDDVLMACGWRLIEEGPGPDRILYWAAPDDVPIDPMHGGEYANGDQPDPTASIDAALTLVPKGMRWLVGCGQLEPTEPLYGAQIRKPGFSTGGVVISEGESNHMAIALCIAALKARLPDAWP